jgi:hypothetical protein
LNEVIGSAARLRLANQLRGRIATGFEKFIEWDRLSSPRATSAANNAVLRSSDEATVRLMPIGLLTSWATPATSRPSAASFSASIREFWVSRRLRNADSAASLALRISCSPRLRSPISSATVTICSISPSASRSGSLFTSHCRKLPEESRYSSS